MHRLICLLAVVVLSGCAQTIQPTPAPVEVKSIGESIQTEPTIEELAGQWDVTIVWSSNREVNCGAAASAEGEGGCYLPDWPDMVWISKGMDDVTTRDVLLHEIGHVLQARNGEPFDECNAEAFAHAQGAPLNLYDCP